MDAIKRTVKRLAFIKRATQSVYEKIYSQRAPIENRVKELLYGLHIDRTSCTRVLPTSALLCAAYVLLQKLRQKTKRTSLAGVKVTALGERLLKLAVWVQRSTRRLVFHLPHSAP
jgi:hypothetical protein